jgi:uncharacterized protein YyaL (SSP411 family)
MVAAPVGVPQMLVAYQFRLAKPKQIVLAGERDAAETRALLAELHCRFLPNRIALLVNAESRDHLARYSPAFAEMQPIGGRTAAYVCEDYTCQLPTADVAEFGQLLQ